MAIVPRARPLDDCQLEKYSNSITIFFPSPADDRTPRHRRNFKPWARLRRKIHSSNREGLRAHAGGRGLQADVKLISNTAIVSESF